MFTVWQFATTHYL